MTGLLRRLAAGAGFAVAVCAGAIAFHAVLPMAAEPRVIRITAKKFEYNPQKIVLKKGVPVVLELVALDRIHGFRILGLGLRADVLPDQAVRVEFTPDKAGRFVFACDVFCGDGHEDMDGVIVVEE